MKTVKVYLIAISALLILSVSCEKSGEVIPYDDTTLQGMETSNTLANKKGGTRTIPFEAKFYTKRNYDVVIGTCDEAPYLGYNYQVGEGTATHMGKIKAELYFCGVPGAFDYKNGEGVFVAANGDELWYQIPSAGETGLVMPLPYADPLYEFYFQDPFTIVGGTGRFEGATGSGYTDSYVDLFVDGDPTQFIPEHQTDHVWTGTLTLPGN